MYERFSDLEAVFDCVLVYSCAAIAIIGLMSMREEYNKVVWIVLAIVAQSRAMFLWCLMKKRRCPNVR